MTLIHLHDTILLIFDKSSGNGFSRSKFLILSYDIYCVCD